MPDYRIPLTEPVAAEQVGELAQRIYFLSESIVDFVLPGVGDVTEVVVTTEGDVDPAVLADKLNRMVDEEVRPQLSGPPRVVWRSPNSDEARNVADELLASGELVPMGPGQFALGPVVTALLDYVDRRLLRAVTEEFGARAYRYPTLIETETLRRCGYFTSFPHFLMLVTRLHADSDNYREFVTAARAESEGLPPLLDYCDDTSLCLPPTMCYHTYRQFQGQRLSEPGLVVTARGKSFRHESRYWRSLERLWDFTIREVVFLGDRDRVLAQRQRMLELTTELAVELGLGGHCEVGNDPFFGSVESPQRAWSQRLLELKYELRLPIGEGRTLAAASFNFHEDFFGSSFDIRRPAGDGDEDATVITACAGVGLERFAYAFLCRHGVDPAAWPEPVRLAVAGSPAVTG